MANNCFRIKLEGVVHKDNLLHIGECVWPITKPSAAASQENIVDTAVQRLPVPYYNSDHTKYIIPEKYILQRINAYRLEYCVRINLDELKWCDQLSYVNISWQYVTGKLSSLPSAHITYLTVGDYEGELTEIGHMTSLIEVGISPNKHMKLTGNVEDFVNLQIANGRTSCSEFYIGFKYSPNIPINDGIYFQGDELTGNCKKITWNWDGSSANISVTDYAGA